MRSVDVDGLDIDSHDLFFGSVFVNGVDVVPPVDAEVNRQFPDRELQKVQTPEGLREGWVAVQSADQRRWRVAFRLVRSRCVCQAHRFVVWAGAAAS
jgi:hypothetical protein